MVEKTSKKLHLELFITTLFLSFQMAQAVMTKTAFHAIRALDGTCSSVACEDKSWHSQRKSGAMPHQAATAFQTSVGRGQRNKTWSTSSTSVEHMG